MPIDIILRLWESSRKTYIQKERSRGGQGIVYLVVRTVQDTPRQVNNFYIRCWYNGENFAFINVGLRRKSAGNMGKPQRGSHCRFYLRSCPGQSLDSVSIARVLRTLTRPREMPNSSAALSTKELASSMKYAPEALNNFTIQIYEKSPYLVLVYEEKSWHSLLNDMHASKRS